MVIKRSDLIKQFDLVVKQEIINHNKQIEATNQALREMQIKVDTLVHNHASHIAKLESIMWDIGSRFEKLEKEVKNQEHNQNVANKNLERLIDQNYFEFHNRIDDIEDYVACEDHVNDLFEEIEHTIKKFEEMIQTQKFYMHSEFISIKQNLADLFLNYRKDIEEKPSEIPLIKHELEKKIHEAKTDTKCLLEELQLFKNESFIINKKLEHIYNLLGRNGDGGKK